MKKYFTGKLEFFISILWAVYFLFVLFLYQTDASEKTLMQSSLIAIVSLLAIILRSIVNLMKSILLLAKSLTERNLIIDKIINGEAMKPKSENKDE